MRPGRLERYIFVPPPDKEGRKQIFEVYLKDDDFLLTADITIDALVERTEGYVGADIEALIREAKMSSMREYISLMTGRSDREMEDAAANVRITNRHFEEACTRIRRSLDDEAIRRYAHESWKILYNQDQRRILEKAARFILSAGEVSIPEEDIQVLREQLYGESTKNFSQIQERTQELDKKYGLTLVGDTEL